LRIRRRSVIGALELRGEVSQKSRRDRVSSLSREEKEAELGPLGADNENIGDEW